VLATEIAMLSGVIAGRLAGDPGYQVIRQLPGIGPVLAAVIIAEIGDVTRFRSAARLCSWAGLTPRHRESDVKVSRGHVTRQGSRMLRWALVEAIQRIPRLGGQRRQGPHHRPPWQAGKEHRQGRRRPAAPYAGLLRPA
jgi:transposase